MNSTSFDVFSRVQDVYFKPENITATYDGLRSVLNIFINFCYRVPTQETPFDVTNIQAKLKLQSQTSMLLSTTNVISCESVTNREHDTGEHFPFIMDKEALHAIENHRNGDAKFIIELQFSIAVKTEIVVQELSIKSSRHVEKKTASLYLTIPRSVWIEKILPSIGYKNLKLIEIPLTHENLEEAYDHIIFEFNEAEKYFNKQDYNKCIAHCRSTLDALTRNLKKIKALTPSETAFEWLKSVDAATFNWIDELNKSTQSLTSKVHHAGHKTDFTRQEAESIYLVTLGLLNFIGHIK